MYLNFITISLSFIIVFIGHYYCFLLVAVFFNYYYLIFQNFSFLKVFFLSGFIILIFMCEILISSLLFLVILLLLLRSLLLLQAYQYQIGFVCISNIIRTFQIFRFKRATRQNSNNIICIYVSKQ
jgi:hypothetical protein